MDCVIIGGGAAGMQAALTIRQQWPEKTVAVIDTEKEIGYYRTLLPQFMNKTLTEKKMFFWRAHHDPQLQVISGVTAEGIDQENRTLFLDNKDRIHYQRLLIASGGRPIVPGICAARSVNGIFPIRSLRVARIARDWLPDHREVVIVGGGLVGVKTAVHLAGFDFSITLIEKENQLLPHALSAEASKLVEAQLRQKKIQLLLGNSLDDLQFANDAIHAAKVDGRWIPCQTMFVAAGSAPELGFLDGSNLVKEDDRLEVSTALQTRDKNIFAAGDAVTIVDNDRFTPWTWPQAVVQGKLAAQNLYASSPLSLNTLSRVNAMNLNGLSLAVLGIPVAGAERSVYWRPESGEYRELFHVDGRIVGGALIGNISNAGGLHQIMNSGMRIEGDFDELLEPRIDTFSKNSSCCIKYNRRAAIVLPQGV